MSTAALLTPTVETPAEPVPPPAPAPEPVLRPLIWGPGWDVCPWCDCGTPSDARRPCGCGAQMFLIVQNEKAAERCRHVCRRCYREPHRRLARPGDQVVGTYDCVSGAFAPA